ncbi:hypothetical protein [Pelagibius sp.]|uniref:hypothetical protein n=1 Tax=Pelagibius sp. TaxID=1931238 RepID=UPI00262B074F|nr:hypothetical protein [Pelagibius sp.]
MTATTVDPRNAVTIQRDLADLALELVDRVGVEGAIRYCHSLGWGGVAAQIETMRARREFQD